MLLFSDFFPQIVLVASLEQDVPKIVTVHWARVTDSQVNAMVMAMSVCKDGLASLVKVSIKVRAGLAG